MLSLEARNAPDESEFARRLASEIGRVSLQSDPVLPNRGV